MGVENLRKESRGNLSLSFGKHFQGVTDLNNNQILSQILFCRMLLFYYNPTILHQEDNLCRMFWRIKQSWNDDREKNLGIISKK